MKRLVLWIGWATVVLLAYAACGQSFGSYAISRWAGVGVGLILSITAYRRRPEPLWAPFWGCLVLAGLLAGGPQHLHEWTCDEGDYVVCDPLPYGQLIRMWTVFDVVNGWALTRLQAVWRRDAEAEWEAEIAALPLETPALPPPSGGSAYDTETGKSIPLP
jgi:hypothetical protein